MSNKTFVSTKEASKLLNVHPNTLRSWESKGLISSYRINESGQRKYNISNFLENKAKQISIQEEVTDKQLINICYCRVSSKNQKEDLDNQINFLKEKFPNHVFITDIGSGLNYKRKGLKTLLDKCLQGVVGEVVVTYKDRLCRFGFDLIDWIISRSGGKIVVLSENETTSPEEEMVEDLTSIIHVFSCRLYGLRRYKKTIKKACREKETS
jgi:putative resolvase